MPRSCRWRVVTSSRPLPIFLRGVSWFKRKKKKKQKQPGLDWSYLEHVDCSSRDVPVHRLSWSLALTARLACMSLMNPLCFKRSLLRTSLNREWRGGLGWRNVPKECELDFLIALPRARMRSTILTNSRTAVDREKKERKKRAGAIFRNGAYRLSLKRLVSRNQLFRRIGQ